MGIFSNLSPFDADVEKVTPEEDKNSEDWGSMLDICDKVGDSTQNAKDCLRSIIRRLNNPNPHVVLKAITLLDVCVKNCLRVFHLEIASREFEQEYRKILKKTQQHPKVADYLKLTLKKWAENEFKSDSQLSLIPALYSKLKQEGVDFSNLSDSSSKNNSSNVQLRDPNAVTCQQEVDDIAKAIELSLRETSISSGSNSLYPSTTNMSGAGSKASHQSNNAKHKKMVKSLYDFEAAEDNELTFYAGEMIEVVDDSDKNWWKGVNQRGEGLFPANFVTSDLSSSGPSSELEKTDTSGKSKSRVNFSDSVSVNVIEDTRKENLVINEQKIDRLLHLLHEANPTDESADTEEMINLEGEVNDMGPLIDTELEKVDRKHAQLTQLSSNLVDALNLYHTLMREPFLASRPRCEATYIPPMSVHHTLPHSSVMYHSGFNGPYSLPPPGLMNEQYAPNAIPSMVQQVPGVPQQMNQSSHHFVPISTMPLQSDGYHRPNMITSPPAPAHSFAPNVDSNQVSMQYNLQPNTMLPHQPPTQNLYQQIQQPLIAQESVPLGGTSLQNNPRI